MPGIEWSLVTRIVEGTALLFVGAWVNRRFESRPVLYSYFGHVSAFKYTPPSRCVTGLRCALCKLVEGPSLCRVSQAPPDPRSEEPGYRFPSGRPESPMQTS